MTDKMEFPNLSPFSLFLRTGRRIKETEKAARIEAKFNPWHDPENGRFTFAGQGRYYGRGPGQLAGAPGPAPARSRQPRAASGGSHQQDHGERRMRMAVPEAVLTSVHRQFLSEAAKYPARLGTQDDWPASGLSKGAFKDQFIAGHANAIRAAAEQFDVPVELVASIAHAELGNDVNNDLAYVLRSERGRNLPDIPILREFNRPRDQTSFGFYNIQQRRAAEILGYGDIGRMSETARRTLVPTTRDPVAATFMLAKHLSDLRDQDFPGVEGKALTASQLATIATRYKYGPEKPGSFIQSKTTDGYSYISRWRRISKILQ